MIKGDVLHTCDGPINLEPGEFIPVSPTPLELSQAAEIVNLRAQCELLRDHLSSLRGHISDLRSMLTSLEKRVK